MANTLILLACLSVAVVYSADGIAVVHPANAVDFDMQGSLCPGNLSLGPLAATVRSQIGTNYVTGVDCVLTVTALSSSAKVQAFFSLFQLSSSLSCGDKVTFYNGASTSKKKQLAEFCGGSAASEVTSSGNQMTIKFTARGGNTDAGFILQVYSFSSVSCYACYLLDCPTIRYKETISIRQFEHDCYACTKAFVPGSNYSIRACAKTKENLLTALRIFEPVPGEFAGCRTMARLDGGYQTACICKSDYCNKAAGLQMPTPSAVFIISTLLALTCYENGTI